MTTNNFGLNTPAFGTSSWHTPINDNWYALDTLLAFMASNPGGTMKGQWTNSTAYVVDDIAVDVDGALYKCLVAHTSAAASNTFTADRTANPTYWLIVTNYITGGENLMSRASVVAQVATTFDLSNTLSLNYVSSYVGNYFSTAGTPGPLEFRFTLAGTPIVDTYEGTIYRIGTGAGGSTASTANSFDISNTMTDDEEVAFWIEVRFAGHTVSADQFFVKYHTMHYDGSSMCSQEGIFRVEVPYASVDGISLQNTGTTITASCATNWKVNV